MKRKYTIDKRDADAVKQIGETLFAEGEHVRKKYPAAHATESSREVASPALFLSDILKAFGSALIKLGNRLKRS